MKLEFPVIVMLLI